MILKRICSGVWQAIAVQQVDEADGCQNLVVMQRLSAAAYLGRYPAAQEVLHCRCSFW
jgi:hypothetical protein